MLRKYFDPLIGASTTAKRLVIAIIIFSSMITVATTALQISIEYRDGVRQIRDDVDHFRTGALTTLVRSVWVSDREQVQTILEGLRRLPDVTYAAISVNGNAEWVVGSSSQTERSVTETFPLQFTYRGQQLEIGRLEVVSSLNALYQKLARDLALILAGNALKTFLVSGFVLIALHFLYFRHLFQIAAWARGFTLSHDTPPLDLGRNRRATASDELDQVVSAFNAMQANLLASYDRQKNHERDLERRIAERTVALTDAHRRSERLTALGELTNSVGHEMRHPISVIQNSLFMLRRNLGPETPHTKSLDRAERNLDRCERLISDLHRYAADVAPAFQPVDFDQLVTECVHQYQQVPGITVHTVLEAPQVCILADPRAVATAIGAVLENAHHAVAEIDDPGDAAFRSVTIMTSVVNQTVRLSITDTGVGIAAKDLPRIFEPLFSTKGFGIGLGLPTVRKIVDQHHGRVEVDTGPEQGTCFCLFFPIQAVTAVTKSATRVASPARSARHKVA